MQLRDYATTMARYNQWMNEKLYAAAAELSDEQRKADRGAFFASLHGTFNHLLLADQAWLQRFRGEPVTMRTPRDELHEDFTALREARTRMDADIHAWAAGLGEAPEEFRFYSVTYQRERVIPFHAAVLQFFNHQTHHRGQATTLLFQFGVDPGITDLAWMPGLERS